VALNKSTITFILEIIVGKLLWIEFIIIYLIFIILKSGNRTNIFKGGILFINKSFVELIGKFVL